MGDNAAGPQSGGGEGFDVMNYKEGLRRQPQQGFRPEQVMATALGPQGKML